MKSEDKKVIKEIMQNRELERNLPVYTNAYVNAVYEYSLIHFVLNYYTLKEVEDETNGISRDETLNAIMNEVHTLLYQMVLSGNLQEDYTQTVIRIDDIRNRIIEKMTVLTSYTDALQLYEYMLNRVEYGITGEEYPVEESSLAARVFQYLFHDQDKMVTNSKIQLVTGQLPIRMTKNRFFDYLSDTLNIYKGSEQSSLDDFIEQLKSTALLKTPKGYGVDYKEIVSFIHTLEETDFKSLDLSGFQGIMEQFALTTEHLTELVSNYMLAAELINDFYTILLMLPYETNQEIGVKTCVSMVEGLHNAFVSGGEIPESVDEGFMQIEGLQEHLGEDIIQFEAVLPDVLETHKSTIDGMMLEKMFNSLLLSSKLLSNSLFIDLSREDADSPLVDADYVNEKLTEFIKELSDFFSNHSRERNRAVMASMFSSMPVLFNSQEEVKQYIEYSLNHCSNASELMACAKILDDLMAEE